jgi:hypothetical protein
LADSDRAHFLHAARGVAREAGEPLPLEVSAPAQLPPDIVEFTGRTRQAEWLVADLDGGGRSRAVRVATITGAGGMGKSALAIHVAHRLRTEFPDGRLFVELHGSREQPVSKADALTMLLRHLGVREAAMPKDEADRIAVYRTKIADRRMLIPTGTWYWDKSYLTARGGFTFTLYGVPIGIPAGDMFISAYLQPDPNRNYVDVYELTYSWGTVFTIANWQVHFDVYAPGGAHIWHVYTGTHWGLYGGGSGWGYIYNAYTAVAFPRYSVIDGTITAEDRQLGVRYTVNPYPHRASLWLGM